VDQNDQNNPDDHQRLVRPIGFSSSISQRDIVHHAFGIVGTNHVLHVHEGARYSFKVLCKDFKACFDLKNMLSICFIITSHFTKRSGIIDFFDAKEREKNNFFLNNCLKRDFFLT